MVSTPTNIKHDLKTKETERVIKVLHALARKDINFCLCIFINENNPNTISMVTNIIGVFISEIKCLTEKLLFKSKNVLGAKGLTLRINVHYLSLR